MSKSLIWLSYDLGVRGDYEGLYMWLDSYKAKECGDSVALLTYEYSWAMLDALKTDLKNCIEITKKTRIYVIYRDGNTSKMKGIFLFGGRRTPAWSGYSDEDQPSDEE